jgi:hypothetical protein
MQPDDNVNSNRRQRHFQLQAYRVLSHPAETLMAVTDKITARMLNRIAKGGHDCAICGATLNLDPKSDSSPGIIGYLHGDFPKDIDGIGVTVCCDCVTRLGDKEAARTTVQMFLDEKCGGGTVTELQGGTA